MHLPAFVFFFFDKVRFYLLKYQDDTKANNPAAFLLNGILFLVAESAQLQQSLQTPLVVLYWVVVVVVVVV